MIADKKDISNFLLEYKTKSLKLCNHEKYEYVLDEKINNFLNFKCNENIAYIFTIETIKKIIVKKESSVTGELVKYIVNFPSCNNSSTYFTF